ncbi:phosphotransferase family protein [Penicillium hispanicum]|uniref:phosphotransferase family protein n=1 Tax=Penicillium hispanicum TaxID=1080232 RepID=UPI00253F6F5C|nr:phosphotransferase family protein [Penicillium hispanicum]KAJ5573731.1 phosphotransferase family protein [Penicillium hispanicum]
MAQMKTFPDSSFFREGRAPALSSPAEIRAINEQSGKKVGFNWPPPVEIPSMGLFVKYGTDVTVTEAETQIMLLERFQGRLPVPEVFGWAIDGGQTFVYMALIEGETLMARWGSLTDNEKQSIFKELRSLITLLRTLQQDPHDQYIGSLGKEPLHDIFLKSAGISGPFHGVDAVKQLQEACWMEMTHQAPIVFTHNDLLPPNIMVSKGPNPKVTALIDWTQSGWYPAYWEYCKAFRVGVNRRYFPAAFTEEWHSQLHLILERVEDTIYHPWLYFVISRGI